MHVCVHAYVHLLTKKLPFTSLSEIFLPLYSNLKLSSANFQFGKIQNFSFGKGLTLNKLKEFAEDNSKFDENGRKFSERVEDTVGGEILLQ